MGRKLLDTTFLIDYWNGEPGVEAYLSSADPGTEFLTTPITIKEIAVGRRQQGSFQRSEIRSTFDWVETLPLTLDHAYEASTLEAHILDSHGRGRRNSLSADSLIAGVAISLDVPVVTRNVDDFERISGVETESY